MKAIVFAGRDGVRLRNVPDPVLEDQSGAIVTFTECSICGSDSAFYHGKNVASPDTGFCIGHETVGEVAELGRDVRRLKVGDKARWFSIPESRSIVPSGGITEQMNGVSLRPWP